MNYEYANVSYSRHMEWIAERLGNLNHGSLTITNSDIYLT